MQTQNRLLMLLLHCKWVIRASFLVITYFVINGYNNLSTINKDLPNYSITKWGNVSRLKSHFKIGRLFLPNIVIWGQYIWIRTYIWLRNWELVWTGLWAVLAEQHVLQSTLYFCPDQPGKNKKKYQSFIVKNLYKNLEKMIARIIDIFTWLKLW